MKRFFVSAVLIGAFLVTGTGFGYTINDNTLVQKERYGVPISPPTWVDVIGPTTFDLDRIEITRSGSSVRYDIYSNFESDGAFVYRGWYTYLADVALDLDQDGVFDHAIVLKPHIQWITAVYAFPTSLNLGVGVYSVSGWDYSSRFFKYTGLTYGGQWDQTDPKDVMVAGIALPANKVANANVAYDGTEGKWVVTIPDVSGLIGFDDGYDLFWGTASCGNDVGDGSVPPVPEPATILLFGAGLIGLGGLRRRKFLKK
jgi:hypothetical protein